MANQSTMQFAEQCQPLAVIHSSNASGAQTSAYVSAANHHRFAALLDIGATNQNCDFEILQATSAAGANSKSIVNAAGVTKKITQAGGGDDNTIYDIELRSDELDVDGGFCFIAIKATAAAGSVQLSAWLFGLVPRFEPVPTTAWNEVIA